MSRCNRGERHIDERNQGVLLGSLSWDCLFTAIAHQTHQSVALPTLLQTAVDEVYQRLRCDRVFLYQCDAGRMGQVVAEAVSDPRWSLHQTGQDIGLDAEWLEPQETGVEAIADVRTVDLPSRYAEGLARLEVKACLVVPLSCASRRWGVLVAHHCTMPRPWSDSDITGLQQLTVHLGLAIYQADLLAQVQAAQARLEVPVEPQPTPVEQPTTALNQRRDERFQLAAIVESSQDAIISKTPDGIITSWNEAAERLFGYTAQEAIGQSVAMLIPPERQSEETLILDRIRRGERVAPYETQRQRRDGSRVDVALTVSPIRDENGVVIGASKIARDITAQRQAQYALHEQTAILSSFYNSSPLMMGIVELSDHDILHVSDNQATATFFLTTVAALKGQWASDLGAPPEHIQTWIAYYRTSQQQQQPVRFEYAHVTDTNTYWLSVAVSFIGMAESQRPRFSYVAEDISDRKTTELALQSTKEQLELVLQASSEGFWDWDLITNEIYFSPQWKAMLGYADHELDNSLSMWKSLIFEEDLIAALQQVDDYNSGKVDHFEAVQRFHHKDGSTVYILSRALHLKDATGKPIRMVGSHLDISENKRQEFALQASEARYRNIIETTLEGVWMLDAENLTSFINPRMATLLGYSPDDMMGQPLFAFMTEENRAIARSQLNHRRQGVAAQHEFEFQRKDGASLYVLVSASPIWDERGHYAGAIAMMTDISDRKEIEQQLRKSEAALVEAQRMAHLGSWELDIATKQITWSDELFRMFGFDPKNPEPAYTEHFNYIHPEDRSRLQRCLERAMTQGTPYEIELRLLREDGTLGYIEARGKARIDDQGQVEKLVGTALDITDRKRAEEAVRRSEERFRHIAETIQDVFFINTPTVNRVDYISPAYETVWGRSRQSLYDDPGSWLNSIHPEDRLQIEAVLQHQVVGQPFQQEYRIIRPDGSVRWIYSRSFPKFNETGEVESTIGLASDITERKQAELALQESEDRFRVLVTHAPVGIFQADAQGQCLYVNPRWLEMTGLSMADAMGWGWPNALHPDDRALFFAEWTRATQAGRPFGLEYRFQKPDGSVIWVSGRAIAVANESGDIHHYFGTVMDITDRKRAEDDLQHQKEMFQAIVDHIPVMIALFNDQGRMDFINPEFERTLGWSLADWQHQQDTLLKGDADAADRWRTLAKIQAARRHWQDFTVQTATHQHLETTWVSVALSGGRFLGIGQDISDRKHKEIALQRAMEAAEAANLAKSMFLANMSHELRTPLNVILGFVQVMAHDASLSPRQQEDLQTIKRSGDHLLSLINDVLDLSKIEAGHSILEEQGFDLIALLQTLYSMMTERVRTQHLELIVDVAPDVPQFIVADEQKLRQILLNLLSNAIKFTTHGSVTLRVNVEGLTDDPEPASPLTLRFDVIDTGVGIAAAEQETIFDAFVQAEAGRLSVTGTGLGLTISRKLLELMNGSIVVHSIPNCGSTFTVTLPVWLSAPVDRPPTGRGQVIGLVPGQPQYRILVVDDQLENRLLMVRLLSQLGLDVQEATNGQEAIALWQDWRPDLIWMDIRMPVLDGYKATQQIRAMEQGEPTMIIALTAQASPGDRTLAMAAGCNDYLSKPFQEDALFLKMAEHLDLEYVYAADRSHPSSTPLLQSPASGLNEPTEVTLAHTLSTLPEAWLNQLETAAACCDDQLIIDLMAQLSPPASPDVSQLAIHLTELANQYQFGQILNLLHLPPS